MSEEEGMKVCKKIKKKKNALVEGMKKICNYCNNKLLAFLIIVMVISAIIAGFSYFMEDYFETKDLKNDDFFFYENVDSTFEIDDPPRVPLFTGNCIEEEEDVVLGTIPQGHFWGGSFVMDCSDEDPSHYTWHDVQTSIISHFYLYPNGNLTVYPEGEIMIYQYLPMKSHYEIWCQVDYTQLSNGSSNIPIITTEKIEKKNSENLFVPIYIQNCDFNEVKLTKGDFLRLRISGGFLEDDLRFLTPLDTVMRPELLTNSRSKGTYLIFRMNPISIQDKIENLHNQSIKYHFNTLNSLNNISGISLKLYHEEFQVYSKTFKIQNDNSNIYKDDVIIDYSNVASLISRTKDSTKNKYFLEIDVFENKSFNGEQISYVLKKPIYLNIDFNDLSDKTTKWGKLFVPFITISASMFVTYITLVNRIQRKDSTNTEKPSENKSSKSVSEK